MKIGAQEAGVMEALWRASPRTADEIVAEVSQRRGCSQGSVRILLCRMVARGVVSTLIEGPKFLYAPMLAREDYVAGESPSLIERVFDENLMSLSCHFAEHVDLGDPEYEAILRKIDEAA